MGVPTGVGHHQRRVTWASLPLATSRLSFCRP